MAFGQDMEAEICVSMPLRYLLFAK